MREEILGLLNIVSALPKANALINKFIKLINQTISGGATVPNIALGIKAMVMSNTSIAPALLELLQLLELSLSS